MVWWACLFLWLASLHVVPQSRGTTALLLQIAQGRRQHWTRDSVVSSLHRAVPVPAVVLGGCTGWLEHIHMAKLCLDQSGLAHLQSELLQGVTLTKLDEIGVICYCVLPGKPGQITLEQIYAHIPTWCLCHLPSNLVLLGTFLSVH